MYNECVLMIHYWINTVHVYVSKNNTCTAVAWLVSFIINCNIKPFKTDISSAIN